MAPLGAASNNLGLLPAYEKPPASPGEFHCAKRIRARDFAQAKICEGGSGGRKFKEILKIVAWDLVYNVCII